MIPARLLLALACFATTALACDTALELVQQYITYSGCVMAIPGTPRTICYGFEIDTPEAREAIESVGGDYDNVLSGGCLLMDQCEALLHETVEAVFYSQMHQYAPLCNCIEAVLTDVMYSAGRDGLDPEFDTFINEIEDGNHYEASFALEDTTWCTKNKAQCARNAEILKAGCLDNGDGEL